MSLRKFIHTSHHILRPQSMTDAEWAAPRQNESSGGVPFFRKTYSMGNLLKVRKFLEPQFVHSKKHLTSSDVWRCWWIPLTSAEANMRRVLGPHLDAMNSEVWFFSHPGVAWVIFRYDLVIFRVFIAYQTLPKLPFLMPGPAVVGLDTSESWMNSQDEAVDEPKKCWNRILEIKPTAFSDIFLRPTAKYLCIFVGFFGGCCSYIVAIIIHPYPHG